jgi:hypothetical protein
MEAFSDKSNFRRTADWLKVCGKEVGNNHHLATQVGCHIEEICEQLDELMIVGSVADNESLIQASTRLKGLAHRLKMGNTGIRIKDRVKLLDGLCDGEVTGNGVAYLAGFNKEEADRRVLFSNESKLNADGTPVILAGGKIGKSDRYVKPFLVDCV